MNNLLHQYRQQEVVKIIRSLAVTCSAIVLILCVNKLPLKAAETPAENNRRTFADWCRDRDSLSPETKHTVEVLLEKAGTNECDAADRKLSSLTQLKLGNNQISDIKPLASLTGMKELYLSGNPIAPKICPLKPESICNWEPPTQQ